MKVTFEGNTVELSTLALLGQGGEADVYDLGSVVLKIYKGPKHPDVAGDPVREAAAEARLTDAEARLSSFPRNLPARVVAPRALVRDTRKKHVVGYVMDRRDGRALYELGEPRVRRAGGIDLGALVAAMRDLHGTVAALHAAGVVIGDFNDGNVLVDRDRAWLIDADSFAWGRWSCPMFTDRFVDPRLCDASQPIPAPVRPHDTLSDWFAYTVMLFRTLCWVGPFGGVHQPADPARRVPAPARILRGPSVFAQDVIYPRASAPLGGLSDELFDHFAAVFDRGARGPFPAALLDRLRLHRCPTCGVDHVRPRCPSCPRYWFGPGSSERSSLDVGVGQVAVPASWGDLVVTPIDPRTVAWGAHEIPLDPGPGTSMWMTGPTIWHAGPLGAEPIGQVVPLATRAWLRGRFGAGLWRAGGYAVGITFGPRRNSLDDRARLPAIRGRITAQGCVVGEDRAWLWWRETDGARELVRVACIGGGRVIAEATADATDPGWLAGIAGACAAGPMLLVPTDDGIVRVEATARGGLDVTRRFPDTRAFVAAVDDLATVQGGIAVRKNGAPLLLPSCSTGGAPANGASFAGGLAGAPVRAARLTFTTRGTT